jgi:hypothetical protein
MISHKDKYIFTHVPRTGGTSIEHALRENSKPEPLCHKDKNDFETYLQTQHIRLHELLKRSGELGRDLSSYYKFTFVRNPWERILSFYHYHHLSDVTQHKKHPVMTFEQWCEDSIERRKRSTLGTSSLFCVPLGYETQEIMVDFVGRFENLQQDFDHVCNHLKIPLVDLTVQRSTDNIDSCPWHKERGLTLYKPNKPTGEYFNTKLVDLLRPYFTVEINKLGYPETPF